MANRAHRDDEKRPPLAAVDALKRWLDERGLAKAALADPLMTDKQAIQRLLGGVGYLSRTQRRVLEEITEGAVTAKMLEGKQKVPKPKQPPAPPVRPTQAPAPAKAAPSPTEEDVAPDEANVAPTKAAKASGLVDPNDVAAILQKLAPGVLPKVFRDAMVDAGYMADEMGRSRPVANPVLRHKIREWLTEYLLGKARQRERDDREAPPERDEDLIGELNTLIAGARRRLEAEAAKLQAAKPQVQAPTKPAVPAAATIKPAMPVNGGGKP